MLKKNNLTNIKLSVSYIDNYKYNRDFYNKLDYQEYMEWKSSYAIQLLIKYGFFVYGLPFSNVKFSCDAYNDGSIKFFSDGKIGACHYTKYCDRLDIDHLDYESVVNAKNNLTKKEELISNNRKCKNCDNIYLCPGKIYCTDNNCPKNSDYDLNLYIKTFINAKKAGKSHMFKDMEENS